MNEAEKEKSIKEKILSKIEAGKAKMRPKWYFVLRAILLVVGIVITIVALLYIISFIFFILRQTGVWFVPAFGFRGVAVFLISLPWLLIVLAVVFVFLLELLLKQHSIAYSKPILYSLVIVVALAGISGFIISKVGVHERFYDFAESHKMPVAGQIYRDYGFKAYKQVHAVIVEDITEQGLMVKNCKGEILTITTSTETRFPFGIGFRPADRLVILGNRNNGSVQAIGIRKLPNLFMELGIDHDDCLFLPMMHR